MKIAYIENVRLPTEKAHGYQIMKTCEALALSGAEVRLYYADRTNAFHGAEPFTHYDVEPRFSVTALPVFDVLHRAPPFLYGPAYWFLRWSFLRSVVRNAAAFAEADAWYTRDPAVVDTLRTLPEQRPILLELHEDPRANVVRWRRVAPKVAGFVVISTALKDLLMKEGIAEERILVAPDAYDPEEFTGLPNRETARTALGVDQNVFLIVYTGHLFPWKGIDALAPSFGDIPDECELVIVGGNPDDIARIKKLLPTETTRVRFTGHVPRAEAHRWLAAADAALLPTSAKYEIGRLYTSPLKLFEYLAAGLPVIASDVPSSHEILDETIAIFFTPDDGGAFLRAMSALRDRSEDLRSVMRIHARERAQRYTWQERGKGIAAFVSHHS